MTERIPAVILAAGRMLPALQEATGVGAKALIPVGGRPTIDRMMDAIRDAERVGPVKIVCAPESPLLAHVGLLGVTAEGHSYVDSVATGLRAVGSPARILILTGDLPLLTARSLDHFCGEALQSGASIVYSIVRREVSEGAFPGGRRTFVRLRDGTYTGGNIAVLGREFIEGQGARLTAAFAARKNPLALARMFGVGYLLNFLFGRLSRAQVIARAEHILRADIHVVESPYAEIGFDVDKPSNLASAEAALRAQA